MRLYYFTGRNSLPGIARRGITKADLVHIKDGGNSAQIRLRHRGVWLTTDPNPILYTPRSGSSKDHAIAFAHAVKEQAVRFTVQIPDDDPKLVHWFEWGRKALDADLYRKVDGFSQRDRHTRWIYLETVPKSQLFEPYDFETREPLAGWPADFGAGPETDDVTFDAMDLDDPGWGCLHGADGLPYDPRGALRSLERNEAPRAAWEELWARLYHQGEVVETSYAVVPHLVRIHTARGMPTSNTYALAAAIEQARQDERNPDLPESLRGAYQAAWHRLIEMGLAELGTAENPRLISSIVAVVAIGKGQFNLARFAMLTDRDQGKILAEAYRQ